VLHVLMPLWLLVCMVEPTKISPGSMRSGAGDGMLIFYSESSFFTCGGVLADSPFSLLFWAFFKLAAGRAACTYPSCLSGFVTMHWLAALDLAFLGALCASRARGLISNASCASSHTPDSVPRSARTAPVILRSFNKGTCFALEVNRS
jgi:hypothetical protein